MNKSIIQPVYFREANDRERKERFIQTEKLKELYSEEAIFLEEKEIGEELPEKADAVLFPQMIGAVFGRRDEVARIKLPVILMTSEFGTVEMWDWEIAAYMRENLGMKNVFTPYSTEMAKVLLRATATKRKMASGGKFLIFQDSPGEGMQANIFKRFYWWEKECIGSIEKEFGVRVIFKSWRRINEEAEKMSDQEALQIWEKREPPNEGICREQAVRAVKLYMAIRKEILREGDVLGVGSNCLNESFLSGTTPCLAWNWLFEYDGVLWACEGDLVSLISETVFYHALKKPLMMTNLYPFLVGMAALKHEKIDKFPEIKDPEQYALGVHCGYFGFIPQGFCTSWTLRPKVLEIVNDKALAADCRMECGPVVLAKLHADMKRITAIEAYIERYVEYPGSDCRNGALIRYKNHAGHEVMESLSSHHAIIIEGNVAFLIRQLGKIYGIEVEVI